MCDCIEEVNAKFVEMGKNTQLDIPISISVEKGIASVSTVRIATRKLDTSKREKPISLVAGFCPFCGEEYE